MAQELINNSQVSLSRRVTIYSHFLCFYDYGSWLPVSLYSSEAVFGGRLSTQNRIRLPNLYPNWEVICTMALTEMCKCHGSFGGQGQSQRFDPPLADPEHRISKDSPCHWQWGPPTFTHCLVGLCDVGFINHFLPVRELPFSS